MTILSRLRRNLSWLYSRLVGRSRRFPPVEPIRHLRALDEHVGKWVAVKDGEVKAFARTSVELAAELHNRHIQGATIQFVEPPTSSERVGLG